MYACHTDICQNSGTGTRARVARVRAEYPNQLDYTGAGTDFTGVSMMSKKKEKTADRRDFDMDEAIGDSRMIQGFGLQCPSALFNPVILSCQRLDIAERGFGPRTFGL